jgi:hypothetical protein
LLPTLPPRPESNDDDEDVPGLPLTCGNSAEAMLFDLAAIVAA